MPIPEEFKGKLPTPERPKESVYNAFELAPREIEELRARVEAARGVIRVFVHPFYFSYDPDQLSYLDDKDEERYQQASTFIHDTMCTTVDSGVPTFFLEEGEVRFSEYAGGSGDLTSFNKTKQILENSGFKNIVYMIPTQLDQSQPKRPNAAPAMETEDWKYLRNLFQNIGVRRILLGGFNLGLKATHKRDKKYNWVSTRELAGRRQNWRLAGRSGKVTLDGCVGDFYEKLKKDFEVEISHAAFPDNRKTLKPLMKPKESR